MMMDIFSSFDPFSFMSINKYSTMLLMSSMIIIYLIQSTYWSNFNRLNSTINLFKLNINNQLMKTYTNTLKGSTLIITILFSSIIIINLIGMNPYTFSLSSHLIFTMSFGLPLWMSFIISSFMKNAKSSIAHLLPDGAPTWLNPFLILIETTSILVRPLTLSFRLAANMSAGHIVLGLVSIYSASALFNMNISSTLLLATSTMYVLFEFAICLIQAYIFCLLLSLYSNDHAH